MRRPPTAAGVTAVAFSAALAALAALAVAAAGSARAANRPPAISIRFQLTESYTHTQPKTNSTWSSTASITAVQQATAAELARNTILGGERVRSAGLSAQLSSGAQQCSWTGTIVAGAAPQISIQRVGTRYYGMVGWPDRTGLSWKQALASGSASGCPTQAQFSPLQGPKVTSAPTSMMAANERFYSAVFPIPSNLAKKVTIPVSMTTSGAVTGETDTTTAHGTITIG
jgi:hypothetical protein